MNHRLRLPVSFPVQPIRLPFLLFSLLLILGACAPHPISPRQEPSGVDAPSPPAGSVETDEVTDHSYEGARRIILVIGDGMGAAQLTAASLYHTGREDGLALQSLPVRGEVATGSASHEITDSAAAGTALATAVKVENGVVGVRLPGDGTALPSITGDLKELGWGIGLVTTAFTTHATPAAFGANVASRLDYPGIAEDYLSGLRPEVILGGGGFGMEPAAAAEAGYTVVQDADALARESRRLAPGGKIVGLFGNGNLPYLYDGRPSHTPGLVEMAEAAVDVLARNEEGFFLMIEGARIDHAGHANDIRRLIPELLELDAVVQMLLEHPQLQEQTLLVVTADHETGGLAVTRSAGQGVMPEVTWSTTGHTAAKVPLFAGGPGAAALAEVVDNTLLRGALSASLEPPGGGELMAETVVSTPGSPGE
ncbi:MAG: alkaline phosphatase [Alkalispirochaetaceae bacterium]